MAHNDIPAPLRKDSILGPLIKEMEDIELKVVPLSVEEALMKSIVGQQLSVKAATSIYKKFLALFDGIPPSGAMLLEAEDETLRAAGLSYSKIKYVKNVASFFQENKEEDLLALPDDELMKQLTSIKGVGEWTVQMVMIFYLGKKDVFPVKDLGVLIAMCDLFNLDRTEKKVAQKLEVLSERWKPHRSWASIVLWRYKDSLNIKSKK